MKTSSTSIGPTRANREAPSQHSASAVVLRWGIAAAASIAAAFLLPQGEGATALVAQFAAFFALAFLLVNALRQHMALRSACAMAVIGAGLLITGSEAFGSMVLSQSLPDTLVPGLLGAIAGSAASYPVFKRIHRAEGLRAARRHEEGRTR